MSEGDRAHEALFQRWVEACQANPWHWDEYLHRGKSLKKQSRLTRKLLFQRRSLRAPLTFVWWRRWSNLGDGYHPKGE